MERLGSNLKKQVSQKFKVNFRRTIFNQSPILRQQTVLGSPCLESFECISEPATVQFLFGFIRKLCKLQCLEVWEANGNARAHIRSNAVFFVTKRKKDSKVCVPKLKELILHMLSGNFHWLQKCEILEESRESLQKLTILRTNPSNVTSKLFCVLNFGALSAHCNLKSVKIGADMRDLLSNAARGQQITKYVSVHPIFGAGTVSSSRFFYCFEDNEIKTSQVKIQNLMRCFIWYPTIGKS